MSRLEELRNHARLCRKRTKFIAIAACAQNFTIGKRNSIPWHLPEDYKWFRKKTMGHTLVMGRKTFESIGKPLTGRRVIVISFHGISTPNTEVVRSFDELFTMRLPKKVFIVGGGEIYTQTLPMCSELFLTVVKKRYQGDTFFNPAFEGMFHRQEILRDEPEFSIIRYYRSKPQDPRIFQKYFELGWGTISSSERIKLIEKKRFKESGGSGRAARDSG